MSKIEVVIFDWAGTTVDYGCFAPVQAFAQAFKAFGIVVTNNEVREPMGMLKRDHVKYMLNMERISKEWERVHGRKFTEEDIDAVYEKSENGILDVVHDFCEPIPYVLDAIKTLKDKGIKIGSTTGYTREMMDIVIPKAKERGYSPDCCFTSNDVGGVGRPYPYMVFRNMEALKISSTNAVIKVGDTVADIKEGKNAGVIAVGLIEGSSAMGLSKSEFENLSEIEKEENIKRVEGQYKNAGADYVINNMSELVELIEKIQK